MPHMRVCICHALQPSLSNTLSRRTTIPRTLGSRGGLPYSPRLTSAAGSSASGLSSGAVSPLRRSLAPLSPVRRYTGTARDTTTAGLAGASDGAGQLAAAAGDEAEQSEVPLVSEEHNSSQAKQQTHAAVCEPEITQPLLESMSAESRQTEQQRLLDGLQQQTSDAGAAAASMAKGMRRSRVSEQH